MFHATHDIGDLPSGHGLVKHHRIPQSILRSALAAVIALFYSKNIVSAMVRMALGASFSCLEYQCLVPRTKIIGLRGVRALSRGLNDKPKQEITIHRRR
jgi:hypothetical protein